MMAPMSDEVAAYYLPTEDLGDTLRRLVEGLEAAGLLESGFMLEPDQVDELTEAGVSPASRGLLDSFDEQELPAKATAGAVRAWHAAAAAGATQPLFIYFRLLPPGRMAAAWRQEFEAQLGPAEEDLSPHWIVHPYECWLVLDLNDAQGGRARRVLGGQRASGFEGLPPSVQLLGRAGAEVQPAARGVLELRTTAPNAQYLGFVLARLGLGSLYVRIE
jgi:hypothetical protein